MYIKENDKVEELFYQENQTEMEPVSELFCVED